MSRAIYINNLKYNLWPNHTQLKPELPELIPSIKLSEEQKENIYKTTDIFMVNDSTLRSSLPSAFAGCVPLRRYAALDLFEVNPKSGKRAYYTKLLPAFIALHKALEKQLSNMIDTGESSRAFDAVCTIIGSEVDTTHKAFQKTHGWFFMGSKLAASRWGSFVAKGVVCAAAAVSKYKVLQQPLSMVTVLGDSIPILNLVYEHCMDKAKYGHKRTKMIVMMMAAATQILGSARPYTGAASTLGVSEASFHLLPVVLSMSQSWSSIPCVGLFNGYLAAQDYAHSQSEVKMTQNATNTLFSTIEAFSVHFDSVNQFTADENITSILRRRFWREFVLDPMLISDAICKDLATRNVKKGDDENISGKALATLMKLSIIQYFKGLSGQKLEHVEHTFNAVEESYTENLWARNKISELDANLLTKLKSRIFQPNMLSTQLVVYKHGATHMIHVKEAKGNIEEIVKMKFFSFYIASSSIEAAKFNSLIPTTNLFEISSANLFTEPVSGILMLVIYQAFNPLLRADALLYWRQYVDSTPTNFKVGSASNIIKLSVLSTENNSNALANNRGMISTYDRVRFDNYIQPEMSTFIQTLTPFLPSLYHTNPWIHDSVYACIEDLFKDSMQRSLFAQVHEFMNGVLAQKTSAEYTPEVHKKLKSFIGLAENVGINEGDAEFMFGGRPGEPDNYYSRFHDYSVYQTYTKQIKGRLGHIYRVFVGQIMKEYNTDIDEYRKQGALIFPDFFGKLLKEKIYTVFPTMQQNIFKDLWSSSHMSVVSQLYLSHNSLSDLYYENPSIFWLPLLKLVIDDKMGSNPSNKADFNIYMNMIKTLKIPIKDAGNYFDFICMWVYPFTFNNVESSKLRNFFDALVKSGGYEHDNLKGASYIVNTNKLQI